ncbi:hypothetical protein SmJEL517_g02463 [Synchytrium microbalum]|uniref:Suppressor of forked domain-containing protein n=1 Tax=Synchytrium microbalum TaxID=1806994 RepID=A0A507CAJ7_9FUNG|nr:uncharacterized protein SmJEL517_g02463 [Synchytrium microbalum]TPX35014.1 hypothetical protein SmJEL517_g02463 [Synchytrium microbalum]
MASKETVNGTASTDAPKSEWDRFWDIVTKNPDDFTSWEFLIRLAETSGGGLTADSPESDIVNLRHCYDTFLAKFPLCFGYWKKYVDWENLLKGKDKAVETFERGVLAIHNSVELWTQYCQFRVENFPADEDSCRMLFERAVASVGYDFYSHSLWDKYIEWEESKGQVTNVVRILDKLIAIPLHQYARFFEKYLQFMGARPPAELVPADQLAELEEQVRHPPAGSEQAVPKNDDEMQLELRKAIYNLKSAVYMKTQEEVLKRWTFEGEIKRPYFHVKPLDESQLANWRKYLDFEEAEGNDARVIILYERCLVACALYDEFWLRYAHYMLSKNNTDGAQNVFYRACFTFIPASRPQARFAYAKFLESQGRAKEARDTYELILQATPGHVECTLRSSQFEMRQGSLETAVQILKKACEGATVDDRGKAYLSAQLAKLLFGSGDIEGCRTTLKEAVAKYSEARFLWMSYVVFEVNQPGAEALKYVREAYDLVKSSNLATPDKRDLSLRCLDVFLERCTDISIINTMESDFQKYSLPTAGGVSGAKKRALEDAASHPAKFVAGAAPVGAGPPVAPAGGYAQGYAYGAPTTAAY